MPNTSLYKRFLSFPIWDTGKKPHICINGSPTEFGNGNLSVTAPRCRMRRLINKLPIMYVNIGITNELTVSRLLPAVDTILQFLTPFHIERLNMAFRHRKLFPFQSDNSKTSVA